MTFPGGGDQRNTNVVLGADVSGYSRGISQAQTQTHGLISTIDQLVSKITQLNRTAGDKLQHGGRNIGFGISAGIADAATFEKQLSSLAGQATLTGTKIGAIKSSISSTFRDLPVSRGEVIQLTAALQELGVKGADNLGKLARTYTKLGAVTGESPIALANGLQQLNKQMSNASADQVAKYANSLLTVSTSAGVSAGDVLSFSQSLAPIAHMAGISLPAVNSISAAFVKSGQDGRVAANAFNSILYDITRNVKTGSPQIAQYANLLGVTVQQFKALSGQQQILGVLQKLGGPQGALTLERWGYEGIRTQAAIAGVTQSGDLVNLVNKGIESSGTTANLDKAAKASFSGLVDQGIRVRNAFTDIGDSIGSTFLPPITKAVSAIAGLAGGAATLVHAFQPLVSIFAAAGGGLAFLTGTLMHLAGIISVGVLAKFLMGSTGLASFRFGRALQRGTEYDKMSKPEQRAQDRFLAGTMRPFQMRFAEAGMRTEAFLASRPDMPITLGQMARMTALAPLRTARFLYQDTRRFTKEAFRDDFERQGLYAGGGPREVFTNLRQAANRPFAGEMADTAAGTGRAWWRNLTAYGTAARRMTGGIIGGAWSGLARATSGIGPPNEGGWLPRAQQIAYTPFARAKDAYDERMKTGPATERTYARLFDKATGESTKLGERFRGLGDHMMAFQSGTKAATVSLLRMGAGATMAGVGGAIGGIGMVASKTLGALFSPLGMVGLTAGTMIYSNYKKHQAEQQATLSDASYLDPMQKYNDIIGITTTSMATFTGAVDQASSVLNQLLGGVTAKSSLADVERGVGSGGSVVASKAPDDATLQMLFNSTGRGGAKNTSAALGQVAAGMNFSDPRQVAVWAQSAVKAGFNPAQVQAAIRSLPRDLTGVPGKGSAAAGKIGSWGAFGEQVQRDQLAGSGAFDWAEDPTKKSQIAMRGQLGGIQAQYARDRDNFNDPYAKYRLGVQELTFAADIGSHVRSSAGRAGDKEASLGDPQANRAKRKLLAENLKEAFSTKKSADDIDAMLKTVDLGGMNKNARIKAITDVVRRAGGNVNELLDTGGAIDPAKFEKRLSQLSGLPNDNAEIKGINKIGAFGRYVTSDKGAVQTALLHPEDPTKYNKALAGMAAEAVKAGKGLSGGTEQIGKLQQQATATTDALYQMATAAQAIVDAQRGVQITQASRLGGYQMQLQDWRTAQKLAADPKATADQQAAVLPGGKAYTAKQQADEGQRQFLIGQVQQLIAFGKQMTRGQEDYDHGRLLQEKNFEIQLGQMTEDFNISQSRAQADFNRTMARQAEDAAQSIYDPWHRVQPKYLADTRSVLANLADQTDRIKQQKADLDRLRRAGVSQKAIDTLQLADPNNQAQTHRIVADIVNNPALVAQINRSIGTRIASTTALTQNSFSLTYRRALADFTRQSHQAEADFNRQRNRAESAQARSLNEMAFQFGQSQRRARQDMTDSLRELTGDLSKVATDGLDLLNGQMKKYAPDVSAAFTTEIGRIRTAYLNSLKGLPKPPAGWGAPAGATPGGVSLNPRAEGGVVPQDAHPTNPRPEGGVVPPTPKKPAAAHYDAAPGGFQTNRYLTAEQNQIYGWVQSGIDRYAWLTAHHFSKTDLQMYNTKVKSMGLRIPYDSKRVATVYSVPAYGLGGISRHRHLAEISERGPEAIIPLDRRGQAYMADMYRAISASLVSQLHGTQITRPTGEAVTQHYDHRQEISGPVTVVADDPKKMFAQLERKQRQDRLSHPGANGR